MERRTWLAGAGLAAAAAGRLMGANDKVNLAIVGLGGRGRDHVQFYSTLASANISAICDVNQAAQERGVALVEKLTGKKPKVYADMRQVFDDKSIDAVSIVTPNHWHALSTIWACQAGKDVYIEKPASHNIFEGQQMVAAARKYGRMVQVGSQSRTIQHKMRAVELLRQGVIGKVYLAKGLCYKRRPSIGKKPDGPTPPGLDWDKFLGPAPMRPFNELRFAYNWHWFWDTGNGDIGNQGVHEMDYARWGLGKNELPKSVYSTGGKFVYDDDQETPNTQSATFDYGDMQVQFEVRGLLTGAEGGLPFRGGHTIGNLFFGSDGYMVVDVAGFQAYKGEKHEKVMDEPFREAKQWDSAPHMDNFLQAVKTRRRESLTAEIEQGALSAALCHMANTSYRLGRKLTMDPATMRYEADAEANRMLTREYRKPYEVPAKV